VIGSPEFLVATPIRWLGLLALATLIGGLTLDLVVLPRAASELATARRRLGRLNTLAVAVLIATTAGELLTRTRTMSGGALAGVLDALPLVLTRTHFGTIWIARFAVLGLLLALSPARARWARLSALPLALAVALTTSLTGHAGDRGDFSLTVLVDWSHAVAAAAWTGGLIGLGLVVFVERSTWPQDLFTAIARRFSRLAGYCLLLVVITGSYNTWVQVPTLSALWTTGYGRVLALKVGLVCVLALLGAVNRLALLPGLGHDRGRRRWAHRLFRLARIAVFGPAPGARPPLPARLASVVTREAVLAVVVFGCTAVLGESTPKSHTGHTSASAEREAGSIRVGMEALHGSGGVPPGWAFAPPAGDPVRGRLVFRRLECFACHAIRGERFPAPSKPGPALTDVGRHHPAGYLLESILNPNAVIVEGDGYTGLDDRSAMPDYRDSLSVSELIDLVAYLKSLGG
jgi:putative copper export protein/mono/diheme cytochrome c family protein